MCMYPRLAIKDGNFIFIFSDFAYNNCSVCQIWHCLLFWPSRYTFEKLIDDAEVVPSPRTRILIIFVGRLQQRRLNLSKPKSYIPVLLTKYALSAQVSVPCLLSCGNGGLLKNITIMTVLELYLHKLFSSWKCGRSIVVVERSASLCAPHAWARALDLVHSH